MAKAEENTAGAETVVRADVTERGVSLLQLIKDSENGYLFLTQAEATDALADGSVQLNESVADPNDGTRAVSLTGKGEAMLGAAPARAKGVKHQLAVSAGIDTDIPPPPSAGPKRGPNGGSKYPFDTMEVNQSFHIPKTAEQPDPLNSIQTSISQAHQKFAVDDLDANGNQQMIEAIETTYKKGADGKVLVGADGKRVVDTKTTVTKPKQKYTRAFVAANVDASDPKGPGARVWRTA